MVHSNDSELIKESDGDSWDITVKIDVGETVADLNKHTNADSSTLLQITDMDVVVKRAGGNLVTVHLTEDGGGISIKYGVNGDLDLRDPLCSWNVLTHKVHVQIF